MSNGAPFSADSILSREGPGVEPPAPARSIGELIADARNLSADDLDRIAQYQRENGMRFGEAAIALGLADTDDVLQALAQQFKYAYADEDRRRNHPELVMLNQPFGHQAEAFRAIRSQILLRSQEVGEQGPRPALAVVSVDSGDGKTYFCANLAVALAQLGGKVLLIDADMRGARMHQVFDVDNSNGLSGVLSGRGGKGVIKPVKGVPNLFVLPVGVQPPNPLELVEGPAFTMLLREVGVKFDHVIVDSPAAVFGADGAVIASRCGSARATSRRNAPVTRAWNWRVLSPPWNA